MRLHNISTIHGNGEGNGQLVPTEYAIRPSARTASVDEGSRALSLLALTSYAIAGSLAMFAAMPRQGRSKGQLLATFPRCLIHCSRHPLRLFFGTLEAIMAFGAILIEPDDLPSNRAGDLRTPSVSRRSEFWFWWSRLFRHAQSPRSKSGSLAIFAAILRASSFVSNFAADRRYGSFE